MRTQAQTPTDLPTVTPGPEGAASLGRPRILLYAHDGPGSESARRVLLLTEALTQEFPGATVVIAASSGLLPESRVPRGIDLIQLPALGRMGAERYEPGCVERCVGQLRAARREVLSLAVLGFAPDLVVVDEDPRGCDGELGELVAELRARHPRVRLVLGIQDLKGEPELVRGLLAVSDLFATIDRVYDELWIYGSRDVFDTVAEYRFPEAVARKSHFCGYLQRRRVPSRPRAGLPRVLVAVDDDASGSRLVETYLEGLRWLEGRLALRTSLAFDASVSSERRAELLRRFGHLPELEFHDLDAHPERLFAQADVVISSARYANVCDILSFGLRAVLVPRMQPSWEQVCRARRLAALGILEVIESHALEPDLLILKLLDALESGRRPRGSIDLGGLTHIGERARSLVAAAAEPELVA